MGKGTEAKTDRNQDLINDYLAASEEGTRKYTIIDLVQKYQITPKRIYEILKANNVPTKWRVTKIDKSVKKKAKKSQ